MAKSKLSSFILKLLVKGLNGANLYDTRVQEELSQLPQGFSVGIDIFPQGNYVNFVLSTEGVFRLKQCKNPDLVIVFKNNKVAKKVLLGKQGIPQAFSNHAILLKGDIYKAMGLVRIINIVENYLFPKFYTKAIPFERKQVSSFKMYMYVLFGKSNKKLKVVKNEK